MKNKKAMALYYPAITGFVVGLAIFYVASLMDQPKYSTNYVGELSLNILQDTKSLERDLFFIKESGKYASYQSIYDLGESGGFYSGPDCGSYINTNYWISPIAACLVSDIELKKNLGRHINKNIDVHLGSYEGTKRLKDNYDFAILDENEKTTIIATATLPLYKNIFLRKTNEEVAAAPIGRYQVKPSFEHKVDYDLGDYGKTRKVAEEIDKKCKVEKDVDKCVNDFIEELNKKDPKEFDFHLSGSNNEEKVFYSFAEFYQDCLDSRDMDCYCEYDAPEIKEARKFKIVVSKDDEEPTKTKMSFSGTKFFGAYRINSEGPNKIESYNKDMWQDDVNYYTTYAPDGTLSKAELEWLIGDWDINGKLRLYKDKTNKVAFIDTDDYGEFDHLDECKLNKRRFRLIAENPNKKLFVSNSLGTGLKTMKIELAMHLRDNKPPEPVKNIRISDESKDEGSVIVKWGKVKDEDVDHYTVYYYLMEDLGSPINTLSELEAKPYVKSREVIVEKKIKSFGFDDPKCILIEDKEERKKCSFEYSSENEKGEKIEFRLMDKASYYLFDNEEYFYVIGDLVDNKEYGFLVVATDYSGNRIEELNKLNKVDGKSKDDLPPGLVKKISIVPDSVNKKLTISWEPTLNKGDQPINLDGSEAKGYIYYYAYYQAEAIDGSTKTDWIAMPYCQRIRDTECSKGYSDGYKYSFVVYAYDEAGNYYGEGKERDNLVERTWQTS